MKVDVIGGGPAGLYASLLLKKSHPEWDVTIYERNPQGATYGWGVVFSDRTLTGFREADYPTYEEITDNFVLWDAIDISIKGELVRCNGHAFAGIGRRHLLRILAQRCLDLGVSIKYDTDMIVDRLPGSQDLIIAADGRNSPTRERYATTFRPSLSAGNSKYIWFGTDRVYDAFTFVFRDTEWGFFQAHAYPFDASTSTFIVECTSETWQAAGLGKSTEEESVEFCEEAFGFHLGSHRLLSNHSSWLNFETLKNRRWSHENIVLLGDAVHTAHFSIGSGTKLAMEDAISLAEGFEIHDDIQAAFRHYEQDRRPRQDIIQQAAAESQRYFETVSRYLEFDPLQFSFHLLTRSGRINWDNLRTRDPYFINDVERWFRSTVVERPANSDILLSPPAMYTPLQLSGTTLPNRVCFLQRAQDRSIDGVPAGEIGGQLKRLAAGGAGLVMTEPVAVSPEGRITSHSPGSYTEEQCHCWRDYVNCFHRHRDSYLGVELTHAGRRGSTLPRKYGLDRPLRTGGWDLVAPSSLPYSSLSQVPRACTGDDLERLIEAFVSAATMADEAGFNVLQLDMSHGYLLGSFLSPLTNERQDEYGGELANRVRFPLAIFEAVRGAWPAEKPLFVALNATDWQRGGWHSTDAVELACRLKSAGCDLIAVRAGQTTIDARPRYDFESLAYFTDLIRNDAGIPTMATGYMTTSNQINTLLAGGRADLCIYTPPPKRG